MSELANLLTQRFTAQPKSTALPAPDSLGGQLLQRLEERRQTMNERLPEGMWENWEPQLGHPRKYKDALAGIVATFIPDRIRGLLELEDQVGEKLIGKDNYGKVQRLREKLDVFGLREKFMTAQEGLRESAQIARQDYVNEAAKTGGMLYAGAAELNLTVQDTLLMLAAFKAVKLPYGGQSAVKSTLMAAPVRAAMNAATQQGLTLKERASAFAYGTAYMATPALSGLAPNNWLAVFEDIGLNTIITATQWKKMVDDSYAQAEAQGQPELASFNLYMQLIKAHGSDVAYGAFTRAFPKMDLPEAAENLKKSYDAARSEIKVMRPQIPKSQLLTEEGMRNFVLTLDDPREALKVFTSETPSRTQWEELTGSRDRFSAEERKHAAELGRKVIADIGREVEQPEGATQKPTEAAQRGPEATKGLEPGKEPGPGVESPESQQERAGVTEARPEALTVDQRLQQLEQNENRTRYEEREREMLQALSADGRGAEIPGGRRGSTTAPRNPAEAVTERVTAEQEQARADNFDRLYESVTGVADRIGATSDPVFRHENANLLMDIQDAMNARDWTKGERLVQDLRQAVKKHRDWMKKNHKKFPGQEKPQAPAQKLNPGAKQQPPPEMPKLPERPEPDTADLRAIEQAVRGEDKQADSPEFVKKRDDAFAKMAAAQRSGPPENLGASARKNEPVIGGVFSNSLEHVGDLTHRLGEQFSFFEGAYAVEKITREAKYLGRPGEYEQTIKEQIADNAKEKGIPFDDAMRRAKEYGKKYAAAHRQVPVYNRVQWLARQAAIDLGEWKFDAAGKHLQELKSMVDQRTFTAAAGELKLDAQGSPLEYTQDVPKDAAPVERKAAPGQKPPAETSKKPRYTRTPDDLANVPDDVLQREAIDLPKTHVMGLDMGSREFDGTYLSTEAGNRYERPGQKAISVTANIKNPYVIRHGLDWDFFHERFLPEGKDVESATPQERAEAVRQATDYLKAQGYDSVYLPEANTNEGILVVFDRKNVQGLPTGKTAATDTTVPAAKPKRAPGKKQPVGDEVWKEIRDHYNKRGIEFENSEEFKAAIPMRYWRKKGSGALSWDQVLQEIESTWPGAVRADLNAAGVDGYTALGQIFGGRIQDTMPKGFGDEEPIVLANEVQMGETIQRASGPMEVVVSVHPDGRITTVSDKGIVEYRADEAVAMHSEMSRKATPEELSNAQRLADQFRAEGKFAESDDIEVRWDETLADAKKRVAKEREQANALEQAQADIGRSQLRTQVKAVIDNAKLYPEMSVKMANKLLADLDAGKISDPEKAAVEFAGQMSEIAQSQKGGGKLFDAQGDLFGGKMSDDLWGFATTKDQERARQQKQAAVPPKVPEAAKPDASPEREPTEAELAEIDRELAGTVDTPAERAKIMAAIARTGATGQDVRAVLGGKAVVDATTAELRQALTELEGLDRDLRGFAQNAMGAAGAGVPWTTKPEEAPESRLPTKHKPGAKKAERGTSLLAAQPAAESMTFDRAVDWVLDPFKEVFSPQSRGERGREAARIIRKHEGIKRHELAMVESSLKEFLKVGDRMSREEALQFMYDFEAGRPTSNVGLEAGARKLRQLMDQKRDEIRALGKGYLENFITDYFPHIWKRGERTGSIWSEFLRKSPLEGSKAFLKQRSIPTIKEGIALGLEPVSYNPVELTLIKIGEMQKFLTAHNMWDDFRGRGMVQFVPHARGKDYKPAGYVKIKDPIAIVGAPPETWKEAFDQAIVEQLYGVAASLGVDTKRVFNLGRGIWGKAHGDKSVETRFAGPESVLAHEIGHILGKRYGVYDYITREHEKETHTITKGERKGQTETRYPKDVQEARKKLVPELRALSDLRWEGQKVSDYFKQYVRRGAEKEAALLEALIHAPEKFKEVAPNVYARFTTFLNDHPELQSLLGVKAGLVLGVSEMRHDPPGLRTLGEYYASPEVAKVFNNFLSPGIRNNDNTLISGGYNTLRVLGNFMNQMNLAFSGFHALNVTTDDIAGQLGLGLRQALATPGQRMEGLVNIATSPLAPVKYTAAGHSILKAYNMERSQVTDPKTNMILSAIEAAGGAVRMSDYEFNNAVRAWRQTMSSVFKQGEIPKAWKLPHQTLLAATELAMRPVMEFYVPRQKMGAFKILADHEIRRAQKLGMSEEQLHERLVTVWDSVDNRYGQVVYDNFFWSKTLKDAAFLGFRSTGWTVGSIREYGGAVKDVIGTGRRMQRGDAWLSHRTSYVFGAAVSYSVLGAVMGYLLTGEWPSEWKDYYFPKTGKTLPDGSPERLNLPTYAKDMVGYAFRPAATLQHKMHPLWSTLSELWQNEDFYGGEIRGKGDPATIQAQEVTEYLMDKLKPFSFQSYQQLRESGGKPLKTLAISAMGLTAAPSSIARTPANERMIDYIRTQMPQGPRSREDAVAARERSTILARLNRGLEIDWSEYETKFTPDQKARIRTMAKQDFFVTRFKRLPLNVAVDVYAKANDTERAKIRQALNEKIQREPAKDAPNRAAIKRAWEVLRDKKHSPKKK